MSESPFNCRTFFGISRVPLPSTDQEMAFHVNRHGVLAVPTIFWCAVAFLARYWLLLLFVGIASRRDGGASQQLLSGGGVSWSMLLGQSLTFLILACAWHRQPQAGPWARWAWPRVPAIVALVASFNAWWIWPVVSQPASWQWGPDLLLASCSLVDAAFVLAVYRSPYYRQMFSEFPSTTSPMTPSGLNAGPQSSRLRAGDRDKTIHGP